MADWVEKMKDTVQPHVPEPLVAVGILQPAGTWGAAGVRAAIPLAGIFKQKQANQAAGGLAKGAGSSLNPFSFKDGVKMALFALTADKIYAFSGKQRGTNWKVGDELGSWARNDLRIATEPGRLATKVTVDVISSGEHYELEATTAMSRGFSDAFLAELTKA